MKTIEQEGKVYSIVGDTYSYVTIIVTPIADLRGPTKEGLIRVM